MIKNFSHIHAKIEDKDFYFNLEHGTNFIQIKEALFQFQKIIGLHEDQARSQQEQLESEKKSIEDNKPQEVVE